MKFLRANEIAFTERAIRETPPSAWELRATLVAQGGKIRRLFNVAGRDYRALRLATKLDALSEDDAIDLLAANGNLVKRPFAVGESIHLVGFDEATWRAALR